MFFPESEAIAREHPDLREVIEQVDHHLSEISSPAPLRPADFSCVLGADENQVVSVFDLLAKNGVLFGEEMVECRHCQNLMSADAFRQAVEDEDEFECTSCGSLFSTRSEPILVYRMTSQALQQSRGQPHLPSLPQVEEKQAGASPTVRKVEKSTAKDSDTKPQRPLTWLGVAQEVDALLRLPGAKERFREQIKRAAAGWLRRIDEEQRREEARLEAVKQTGVPCFIRAEAIAAGIDQSKVKEIPTDPKDGSFHCIRIIRGTYTLPPDMAPPDQENPEHRQKRIAAAFGHIKAQGFPDVPGGNPYEFPLEAWLPAKLSSDLDPDHSLPLPVPGKRRGIACRAVRVFRHDLGGPLGWRRKARPLGWPIVARTIRPGG